LLRCDEEGRLRGGRVREVSGRSSGPVLVRPDVVLAFPTRQPNQAMLSQGPGLRGTILPG